MSNERCFVITPIGKEDDKIRRHIDGIIEAVIKPALKDYEVIVSHQMSEIGSINKQIIKELYDDKLVIANLSEVNPNVMYELAFRHTIGKPVIVIAEKGTKLPFDISDERTIYYQNDAKGTLELKDKLNEFVSKIDFNEKRSPIIDVIADLKTEDFLLEKVEKASIKSEDSSSFKYILDRLDSIESNMRTMSSRIVKGKTKFPHDNTTTISFSDIDKEISEYEIFDALVKVQNLEKNLEIKSVNVILNKKVIIIEEQLNDLISVPKVFNFYYDTLKKLGLKGIDINM